MATKFKVTSHWNNPEIMVTDEVEVHLNDVFTRYTVRMTSEEAIDLAGALIIAAKRSEVPQS